MSTSSKKFLILLWHQYTVSILISSLVFCGRGPFRVLRSQTLSLLLFQPRSFMHAQAPSCRQCLTLSRSPMSLGTKGRRHTIGNTVHLKSQVIKTQGQHCASCIAKTVLSSLSCASQRPGRIA